MTNDPLSTILSLVNARAVYAGGFVAGGDWSMAFPAPNRLKFFAISRGECWFALEGSDTPFRLGAGDAVLLSGSRPFVVASNLSLTPRDALALFPSDSRQILDIGGGDDLLFLGGHVSLGPNGSALLLDHLPPVMHVEAGRPEAAPLQWLIRQLVEESWGGSLASTFACSSLAQLIFLQTLRGYLAEAVELQPGWLRALADPRIAPVLQLMHKDPARSWHLPELAKAAGMSRTAFAVRFKSVAGTAPLTYLTEWRMRLAEKELREGSMSISDVAGLIGYGSDAAFSNAFKRATGRAPKQFRLSAQKAEEHRPVARLD
jgi:AraC-like DNA-binding protein